MRQPTLLLDILAMSQTMLFFRQGEDEEEQLLDRVFKQVYIPRSLEEVEEYERDHDRLAGEDILAQQHLSIAARPLHRQHLKQHLSASLLYRLSSCNCALSHCSAPASTHYMLSKALAASSGMIRNAIYPE